MEALRESFEEYKRELQSVSGNITGYLLQKEIQIPKRYNLETLKQLFDDGRASSFIEAYNVYVADEKADMLIDLEARRIQEKQAV
ncbi:MAG: hypothetical protein HUJ69_01160 [Lachnospiraceae bacterium]|nr:hypothetical protein [Lachnospiraceae bacterium]